MSDARDPAKRFSTLPERVSFEDLVEEVASEDPGTEPAKDPNREVAWRWGIGIAPGG